MRGVIILKVLKNQGLETIPSDAKVKLTDMGNVKEIMYMKNVNFRSFPVLKLNKDEYMIKSTGEVLEYSHTENRSENKENLRRTFKRIRELINANFSGEKNELAFTITYQENMTDTKRLYDDFRKFLMRLRYSYPNVDYISVVEPQGRGAWHCHVLLRFNDLETVYIPNKEVARLWGLGFVKVKAIKRNVDDLGAYLSAYLGDVEYNQENIKILHDEGMGVDEIIRSTIKEVEVDGVKKKFIKGARLHLYPTGMNIYRKSKGIIEPKKKWMRYHKAKKLVGAGTPTFTSTVKIIDDENNEINSIAYEQYNLKRVLPQCNKLEG